MGDLTQAEEAVTRLLVEGHSHSRIAELRPASRRTVANQLVAAFRKLGISGRPELLAKLIRESAEPARPASATRPRCLPSPGRALDFGEWRRERALPR